MPDERRDTIPGGEAAAAALAVGGVVPFSASDFPGRLAAVVFCQGCPWRCRYCHNPHLLASAAPPATRFADVLAMLDARRGLLDAVVFSGGEPTGQRALPAAIRAVRARGFAVGLHTGGAFPQRLAAVIPLVDWVGFDVKAPADDYAATTGVASSGAAAFASLEILLAAKVDVEVRTTVHPDLLPEASLIALARSLARRGVGRWVLQAFRSQGCADAALAAAAPRGATIDDALFVRLAAIVPGVERRGG